MKYLHHLIDKFILSLIGRSFTILSDKDLKIEKELSFLPKNFSAAVAVDKNSPYIILKKNKNKIKYYGYHNHPENVDLKIYFKDEEFAYQVFSAKEGIRQAFSEHKVILEGDMEYAVSFIYILEIVEFYIMADKFSEELLNHDFERKISRLQLIIKAIFLSREKGEI